MRTLLPTAFGMFACAMAFGQSPQSFQAADVHPSPPGTAATMRIYSHDGRYEIHNATMIDLVRTAYTIDAHKILGGPNWIEYDRFDIIAKLPPNTSRDAVKPMLQALLTDRFKLQVHNDVQPVAGLALTLGKGKPKLKESNGSGEPRCPWQYVRVPNAIPNEPSITLIRLSCHNMTMEGFVAQLGTLASGYVANSVVDLTGLKGAWDFDLGFTAYDRFSVPGSDGISLSDAIDKQLGLKLEQHKLPAPVLTVDSVNRRPTDNSPDLESKLPLLPQPEFEVVAIKPTVPGADRLPQNIGVLPGGRVNLPMLSLKLLVSAAWNLNPADEIAGAPKWLDSVHFDISAKAPLSLIPEGGGAVLLRDLGPALQALLKDRFKMEVHFEDRPVMAYTLAAVKPKLKKADASARTGCKTSPRGVVTVTPSGFMLPTRVVTCQNITLAELAEQLHIIAPNDIRYPVVDGTGLDGVWDLSFTFDPPIVRGGWAVAGPDPVRGTTIFNAVEKQLGLKLEAQKRPYPVMVIDHIEEKPTDN
jgi:uncharacterized protein (TIGR03435 family)